MSLIVVSFSGGKTSAYMARWLQQHTSHDLRYLFANTGAEDERTLGFVDRCAREWGMDIVWLEADVRHGERVGTGYKVVTYETASRNSEPFEEVIKKYGIPNKMYPHCTRELKLAPINVYVKAQGWHERLMAVGIRADEIDRMSVQAHKNKIIYPLIDMHPTTRDDIDIWWEQQPFSLELPEHRGNCVWCWKKSYRKLCTIMEETPEAFDFPARMERDHGLSGHNVDGTHRKFFRQRKSVADLVAMASDVDKFTPNTSAQPDIFWNAAGSCSESCDIYADETA